MGRQFWKPGNMLYPLPCAMVTVQRPGEKPNIITIAWTGTVCTDPAMVYISVRPSRYSYDIIKETGEFVINLTTDDLVRAADYCGVKSGRDIVLAVSIDDEYMDEKGKFHLNKSGIVAYSHGEYFELGKRDGSFGYSVRKKHAKKKEKKK